MRTPLRIAALAVVLVALCWAPGVHAGPDSGAGAKAAAAPASGGAGYSSWKPSSKDQGESATRYVVVAYSAIWIVLVSFVAAVWLRQRKVEQELAELKQRLE